MKRTRKRILITLCAMLAVVTVVFLLYRWNEQENGNDRMPVISCTSDTLVIDVANLSNDELLLTGVVAYDAEDGDITDDLVVESVSKFVDVEERHCIITYAVVDSSNNVSKVTRHLYIKNYISPRFEIIAPLEFSYSSVFDPTEHVTAYDCIDGDISNKVRIELLNSEDTLTAMGAHRVEFSVTNSLGDTQRFETEIVVHNRTYLDGRSIPSVKLTDYLVYIDPYSCNFDAASYIEYISVYDKQYSLEEYDLGGYNIDYGEMDPNDLKEGEVYRILYVFDNGDYVGSSVLVVIVRGGTT